MMTPKTLSISLFIFLLTCFSHSFAATYYVSTSGNDANDGSSANPWRNIQQAADTMVAGDTVIVRAGLYMEPVEFPTTSENKGIRPMNSGSSGMPITYQGEPGAIIDQNYEAHGFYVLDKNYITIKGFEIRKTVIGIWTHSSNSATTLNENIIIENNHIHHSSGIAGFNVGLVRLDACLDCTVRNNLLHHAFVGGTINNQNSAGVISFGMQNATIVNNEMYSVHTGIFHKRFKTDTIVANQGSLFSKNKIHDTVYGIQYSVAGTGNRGHNDQIANYNLIYNNSGPCIISSLRDTSTQSDNLDIHNNTFVECDLELGGFQDIRIYNNIFSNASPRAIGIEAARNSSDKIATIAYSDYNVYFGDAAFTQNLYATNGTREEFDTLADWNTVTAASGGVVAGENGGFTTAALGGARGHTDSSTTTNPQFRAEAARDYTPTASLGNGTPDDLLGTGANLGVGAYVSSNIIGLDPALDSNLADQPRAIEDAQ